jgi:hypothetical protein
VSSTTSVASFTVPLIIRVGADGVIDTNARSERKEDPNSPLVARVERSASNFLCSLLSRSSMPIQYVEVSGSPCDKNGSGDSSGVTAAMKRSYAACD